MQTSIIVPAILGLAIFLFGMKLMELKLHQVAGDRLPRLLRLCTKSPARGMLVSTGLTAVLQSSTAVTVMTIGLVNAGVIRFPQTLGVILGTNVGTCITTELIGLHVNRLALPLLGLSGIVWLVSFAVPPLILLMQQPRRVTAYPLSWGLTGWRKPDHSVGLTATLRQITLAFCGFSIILLGMEVMQSVIPALQEKGLFDWLEQQSKQSLLWGIAAGSAVTALIHSSAVVVAMAMELAGAGAFSPELGIAVIIGANVGTCATALLAGSGGSRFGLYVAVSHVLLNIGGAALFYPFIGLLAEWTGSWSATPGSQLAHAQTMFNLISSLAALPLCYLPALRRIN